MDGTKTGVSNGDAWIWPALTILSASSYQSPAGNSETLYIRIKTAIITMTVRNNVTNNGKFTLILRSCLDLSILRPRIKKGTNKIIKMDSR